MSTLSKTAILLLISLFCYTSCKRGSKVPSNIEVADIDLDSITRRGTIRVLSDYNSVDFMMHKGQPIGFQYELAKQYASERHLTLEFDACNDPSESRQRLADGRADIWAASLIASTESEWNDNLLFAAPYSKSRLVLVGNRKVETLPDTIWVQEGSLEEEWALQIADTLKWCVIPIPNYDREQIVQLVGDGDINYTIAPEHIAKANAWYYPTMTFDIPLSDEFDMAWALRPLALRLSADMSEWLEKFRKTPRFKQIYRRYMADERVHEISSKNTSAETYNDKFETLIEKYLTPNEPQFDLALIQAIIFQESRFNPDAHSWAGASGLMQLMPETAFRFGASDVNDPEQNIMAGIEFLRGRDHRLVQYVPNTRERLRFTLAAYNVGLGHVMDAIRLAKKYERDTAVWEGSVEQAILMKANPTVISDKETVKHGYCRGSEPVSYVRHIIQRAANYRKLLKHQHKRNTEDYF